MTGVIVPALVGWLVARIADVLLGPDEGTYISQTSSCPSCGPACICAKGR